VKTTHKMQVIPEPAPNTRSVLAPTFVGPVMSGAGANSYACGSCGTVLLDRVEYKQVQDIVVKCGKCQAFNEIPTSHHTN
jgi:phage FluMu protein Com